MSEQTYMPNDRYRPFSNGSEHRHWLNINCHRGEKGCRAYNPLASSSRHGCPIEVAVAMGAASDGTIAAKIGLRGGFLEPAPDGRLQRATDAGYIPECPEFRGYDEPDDRPRRGPRPPEGQLDLLDPRNAPTTPRVPVSA